MFSRLTIQLFNFLSGSLKFFSSYQSTNSTEKISQRDAIAFRLEVHIATNYLARFGKDFVERYLCVNFEKLRYVSFV
jgi:hypothetical protein